MKEKNRVRNVQFHFMVSPEERKQIEENMKLLSTENLGAYLRKMALDGYLIHLYLSEVREMIRLLRNATNNLNQIAKVANATGNIYGGEIKMMQERYELLWRSETFGTVQKPSETYPTESALKTDFSL